MATTKKKKRTLRDRKPKQWGWFIGVTILYLAFLYWVKSWWGLLVVPFIFDAYITHYINWGWWKDEDGFTKAVMSWVGQQKGPNSSPCQHPNAHHITTASKVG